jgi:uridylate kinase
MKYVLSVGGSLIVPGEINVNFLRKLKDIIKKSRHKFVIITGGGNTARIYQKGFSKISGKDEEALDWIGISATALNAFLVKAIFDKIAHPRIVLDYSKKINFKEKVIVGGGWKPGVSTDYDAVLAAKKVGAKVIVNLTNVDHVYDKDPKYHKDAKPFPELTWNQMFKIMGSQRVPGGHWPFDPKACRLAKKHGMSVAIMNGTNLNNLENFLKGKKFKGTMIK